MQKWSADAESFEWKGQWTVMTEAASQICLGKMLLFLLAFEGKEYLFFSLQPQIIIRNKTIPTPLG